MDWWPISLYVNNERPPFDDKDVRWAISSFIDRQQIVDVATSARPGLAAAAPRIPGSSPTSTVSRTSSPLQHSSTTEEGRGAPHQEGLEEGRPGVLGRRPGQPAQARHHRLRVERAGDRPRPGGAPKRQGVDASMSPPRLRRPVPEGPVHGRDLRPRRRGERPYYTLRLYQEQHRRGARRAPSTSPGGRTRPTTRSSTTCSSPTCGTSRA